ncbi:MAG: tRNA guanosine(34) transglycosylase Tgt [Candidatus Levybacteria bacterium]|nr:tRNA guanosine(34) transglycosylase Tgt [Candidatus Levybacteria bacterium]
MQNSKFNFKIIEKDNKTMARAGRITTFHGIVNTPAFTPVGTKATVKGMTPLDLKEIGAEILFGNTYHLHLRPGEDTVRSFGGLGKFMGWDGQTITDSGGFQVFSLGQKKIKITEDEEETEAKLVNIKEDGVEFRSHIDGSLHTFTPEKSIEIQKKLGADIMLAFDECAPYPSAKEYARAAMERTHNWAVRSLKAFKSKDYYSWQQALYGIVQGGIYKDLRVESAKFISNLPFDGIAIGGVSVGESKKEMRDVLDWVSPFLPENKPRHLLGIGEVDDIFEAIERGIDTFDCVIPTRFGRYGMVFISAPEGNLKNKFRIDIKKSVFAKDKGPLDKNCNCYACQNFTRGYINHLFRSSELLAYRLASYHNLYFIVNLVKKIREAILEGRFLEMKKKWIG